MPLTPVEVRLAFLDGEGASRPRVHVRARLIPPAYLITDAELEAPYETYSSTAGLVTLFLPPVSQIAPGALYEVTYDGRTRTITVPDGGPFDLSELLVPGFPGNTAGDGTFAIAGLASMDDGTFALAGAASVDDGMF